MQLTQSQIKAYENNCTMFIVPIVQQLETRIIDIMSAELRNICENEFIKKFAPIKKGDKDIFIQEEFYQNESIFYKADGWEQSLPYEDASEMTKEQSRYTIIECIDVRVVRVHDINTNDLQKMEYHDLGYAFFEYYNTQLKEQNINRTYEDNDYVFLIEVKR